MPPRWIMDRSGSVVPFSPRSTTGGGDVTFNPPGQPASILVLPGDGTLTVTWTAPLSDGGKPVTGYVVGISGGSNATVSAGTFSRTITGLTNGTVYPVYVYAQNAVGNGVAALSSGTPTGTSSGGGSTPVSSFTHGNQIVRDNVGARLGFYSTDTRPQVTPTYMAGFTHTSGTRTIENTVFTSRVVVTGGKLVLRNCARVETNATSPTAYGFWVNGGEIDAQGLTIIGQNYASRGIFVNQGAAKIKDFLILGWGDGIQISNGTGALAYPSYVNPEYPDFTGARLLFEDGLIVDGYREAGLHADVTQIDGGGDAIFYKVNFQSHRVVYPATPPATQNTNGADTTSGCFIMTGSNSQVLIKRVGLYKCNFDGGNFTVDTTAGSFADPEQVYIRDCTWGSIDPITGGHVANSNFGAKRFGTGTTASGNTYWKTGTYLRRDTGNVTSITAGSAV